MALYNRPIFYFILALAARDYIIGVRAQLRVTAVTPSSTGSATTPNTFIGTVDNQIAAALLATNTPVLLWGAVASADINAACRQIVNTGSFKITATVSNDWGASESLSLQVVATGGCLAASDGSGTQFVFTDNYGRKSAIVCPDNAGSIGCGVYLTGSDVNKIYNSFQRTRRRLKGFYNNDTDLIDDVEGGRVPSRRRLLSCQSGAQAGAIQGAVTGILSTGGCLGLGPLAPFCVVGVLGVSAGLGALGGCASSCFPGDALVQTQHGKQKKLNELQVGDKVAVWSQDKGSITYDAIYAFGHKDANASTLLYHLMTESLIDKKVQHTIRLSPLHFLPISSKIGKGKKILYKRAQDVHEGDILWATSNDDYTQLVPCVIKDMYVSRVSRGLYNPLTLSGAIIVDGVVASVHSDWFLDSTFDSLGLTKWLPHAYQIVLKPIRFIYFLLGEELYISTYKWVDAKLNIPRFGTTHGGHATLIGVLTTMSFVMVIGIKSLYK